MRKPTYDQIRALLERYANPNGKTATLPGGVTLEIEPYLYRADCVLNHPEQLSVVPEDHNAAYLSREWRDALISIAEFVLEARDHPDDFRDFLDGSPEERWNIWQRDALYLIQCDRVREQLINHIEGMMELDIDKLRLAVTLDRGITPEHKRSWYIFVSDYSLPPDERNLYYDNEQKALAAFDKLKMQVQGSSVELWVTVPGERDRIIDSFLDGKRDRERLDMLSRYRMEVY